MLKAKRLLSKQMLRKLSELYKS